MLSVYTRTIRFVTPISRPLLNSSAWRGKKNKASKRPSTSTDISPELAAMVDLPRFETGMQKAIDALHTNFSRIRAGGASPSVLDGVQVQAYGTSTTLDKVAQVSAKDGRTLLVNVFDEQVTGAVEKAIRGAGLNLNPVRDAQGRLKVPIPRQTEKTRESLAKVALRDAEAAKVATRMVRRKAMDAVKGLKDDIGKDDIKRMENVVQQMSDKYIDSISQSLNEKVKSINVS